MHQKMKAKKKAKSSSNAKGVQELKDHIVEVISDSGEGAQKCAQSFAAIAAKMGNGVWTVEIIPAEIEPPARSIEGASGNRIRVGSFPITNGGDQAVFGCHFAQKVCTSFRGCGMKLIVSPMKGTASAGPR